MFPPEVMKTNREHRVPFALATGQLLQKCFPIEGYYFSPATAIGRPFTAWSKNKDALDKLAGIEPWTLHDLRRTWSTNAARLDVPPHITERILSHVAPEGKVAAIYNRWKFEREMRWAVERMADFILELMI